jgi:hypothetical protein
VNSLRDLAFDTNAYSARPPIGQTGDTAHFITGTLGACCASQSKLGIPVVSRLPFTSIQSSLDFHARRYGQDQQGL